MVLYGAAKNGTGTVSIWAGEREKEGKWLLGRTTEEGKGGRGIMSVLLSALAPSFLRSCPVRTDIGGERYYQRRSPLRTFGQPAMVLRARLEDSFASFPRFCPANTAGGYSDGGRCPQRLAKGGC